MIQSDGLPLPYGAGKSGLFLQGLDFYFLSLLEFPVQTPATRAISQIVILGISSNRYSIRLFILRRIKGTG